MKFRLQRPNISKNLSLFCLKKIKQTKTDFPRATKKIIEELPPILRAIQKKGLPKYLVLKKLEGKLGYGVFLHPESKPILRGSPIAPYSGKVILGPQNERNDSAYAFALISDFSLTKEEQSQWDPKRKYHPRRLYSVDLDAEETGNFTRFINHSEKPNVEAKFVRIPTTAENLAPAVFELVYVAKKMIRPGEQLLVCYEGEDKSYWGPSKIKPFPMTPRTFRLIPHGSEKKLLLTKN